MIKYIFLLPLIFSILFLYAQERQAASGNFLINKGFSNPAVTVLTGKNAAGLVLDPIKGHVEGTITTIEKDHKIFVGSGTTEPMGKVSVEVDYYITYETQYNGNIQSGGMTKIQASNGDELYVIINGGTWYVSSAGDPPAVIFEMTGTINGGKGKFQKATGNTVGTGTQQYIPGTPTVFDWTGTISY